MTKNEMKMKLAERTGMSAKKCNEIIGAIFDGDTGIIATTIASGEKLTLPGFGTFSTKRREARMGTNPATGKPLQIAAKTNVKFSPGKTLKERIE